MKRKIGMRKLLLLMLPIALLAGEAWAGAVTIPNTFTAGTTSSAAQVNGNFTAVKTAVDDNDARITANAANIPSTACPAGFTDVSAAGSQLGCMQTAEQGTGIWETAANTCFTTFGGRLPTSGEWYITMNNFVLTAEVDNWEWNDDGMNNAGAANGHSVSGLGTIFQSSFDSDTVTHAYRCWLPR